MFLSANLHKVWQSSDLNANVPFCHYDPFPERRVRPRVHARESSLPVSRR